MVSYNNSEQLFAEGGLIIEEYSPKITEPEANDCFSIFAQGILILFISLSVICTKRQLVAIL